MKQANKDIRRKIEQSGLHYWQIADQIGVSASTLCIWFRKELDQDKKDLIVQAIKDLSEKEGE